MVQSKPAIIPAIIQPIGQSKPVMIDRSIQHSVNPSHQSIHQSNDGSIQAVNHSTV
jgi:hypothetical protein